METDGIPNETDEGVDDENRRPDGSASAIRRIVGLVVAVVLVLLAQRDLRKRPAELVRGSVRVWKVVAMVGPGAVAYLLFGRRGVAPTVVLDPIDT